MNLQSHLLLAMAMEHHVKEKYGISLRTDAFYYGNIRPDLTPRGFKRYPHTFKDSMPMFRHQCRLLRVGSRLMRPPMYLMSYRLGIILHYTADFFTLAHNDEELFHKTKAHFKYENDLYKALWQGGRHRPNLPSPKGLRLDSYLRLVRQYYYCGKPGPENDADYIYFVCLEVCDRMIERIYLERNIRPKGRIRRYVAKIRRRPPEEQWEPELEREPNLERDLGLDQENAAALRQLAESEKLLLKDNEQKVREAIDKTMERLMEWQLIPRPQSDGREETETTNTEEIKEDKR